jgi:hypothetical protein
MADHAAAGGSAAQALLDAIRRMGRRKLGRVAVVVHLSLLRPPAPRPHHRRIARVMLQDTALRHDGQVFAMPNGDLAMLCHADASAGSGRASSQDPLGLSRTLGRLLRADAIDPDRLVSVWDLQDGAEALLDYAAARLREGGDGVPPTVHPMAKDDAGARPDRVDALAALIDATAAADLLQRQTAILVPPVRVTGDRRPASALRPIFRELRVSLASLEARLAPQIGGGSSVASDPYLFRHLARRLDHRGVALIQATGIGNGLAPPDGERLHLNLSLAGVLSEEFAGLLAALGPALGVEIGVMDSCADPAAWGAARRVLAAAGATLVLDGVSHVAMLVSRPYALDADLLKLDWAPEIAALQAADAARLDDALQRTGPDRLVLHHADTEAAVQWGVARGIRRFQGRHPDAMMAAARMMACGLAGGCTLRQCMERALATGGAGRRSCGNPDLLDARAPTELRLRA